MGTTYLHAVASLDRYIADRYAEGNPITVVSDTLTPEETGPWRDQTTIVRRGRP